MASLAENSIASIPLAHIDKVKDHLLTLSSRPEVVSTAPELRDDAVKPVADRDVGPSSQPQRPPRLATSKSAPPVAMAEWLEPAAASAAPHPVQQVAVTESPHPSNKMERGASSGNNVYVGGDTQQMPSQVYRDFTESIVRTTMSMTTPQHARLDATSSLWMEQDGGDTLATEKTPNTCLPGDATYVDLDPYVQLAQAPDMTQQSEGDYSMDDLLAQSTQTNRHHDLLRDMPETPAALAGRKHGRNGEILISGPATSTPAGATTTGAKTPGFSQFFPRGDQGDVLSATQLFEQTQAPSSPVPDGVQLLSDPVMTRPSPNIAPRFSISSPELPRSSPLLANVPPVSTSTSEPKGTYTSMLESQEHHRLVRQREEQLRRANRSQRGTINFEDDDDDDVDIDDDELFAERRLVEEQRSKRAVSANALEDPRRSRRGSRQIDFINLVTSPFVAGDSTKKTSANNDVSELLDDDRADGDEDNDMMLVEDGKETEIGAEDDDQYDELGQAVLRSQSQNEGGAESENGDIEMEEDGDDGGDVVGGFDGQAEDEETDDEGEDGAAGAHATHDRGGVEDPSQTRPEQLAIADSQPERQAAARTSMIKQQQKAIGQSSPPSFIPGSQYTGRTSQDQAIHSRGRSTLNSSQRQSIARPENDRVPSSPPLPITAEQELPAHIPPLDQNSTAESGQRSSHIVVEVPDSDIAAPGPTDDLSTRPNAKKTQEGATESNSVPLFSTAQTHVSSASDNSRPQSAPPHSSMASPFKRLASQQSKNSTQSPVRKAGVRNFDEILADAAQPNSNNGESQFDVEAFINNIPHIIDEDQQNSEAHSESPGSGRPKRRMMMKASERTSSPSRPSALRSKSAVNFTAEDVGSNAPETTTVEFADQDGGDAPSNPPTTTKALRNSPSKANEMAPISTPTEKQNAESINTPDSVKVRERAGAAAVSQMLAKRSRGSGKVEKNSRANVAAKKGKGKKSAKVAKTKRRNSRAVTAEIRTEMEDEDAAVEAPTIEQVNGDDAMVDGVDEAEEPVRSSVENQGGGALAPDQHMNDATTADQGNNDQTSAEHADAFPNRPVHPRVFALFKGPGENKYYPATLLGWQSDTQQYRVQFDDGIIDLVGPHLVRRLELRVNDAVKIDMPNMRSATWLVKGFGESSENSGLTDMYGHSHIKVQARASRASLPKTDKGPIAQAGEQQITVEVQYVYLSPTMWVHFKDRSLDALSSTTNGSTSRPATPSGALQMPNASTPGSRTRRSLLPTAKLLEKPGREGSVTSSVTPVEKGIFANMAFAISYGGNEAEKASVARAISRNGGIILENGFDELFDLRNFDDEPAHSASKGGADDADAANAGEFSDTLRLRPEYASLGFVALIADRHSRREKFIQALAFNLPTLSGKWITDSLSTDKNPSLSSTTSDNNTNEPTTLPWSKYLLPAGESSYLDGAIRSRSLVPYPPASASLAHTIRDRPRLVPGGTAALIVVSRKAKAALSRRKTFAFLSLALGAVAARSVGDLEEARKLLSTSASSGGSGEERSVKWQWVYVDSDQAQARKALFASAASASASKRSSKGKNAATGKRASGAGARADDEGPNDSTALPSSVRVVDNEFVVQSLILGDLLD